MLIESIFQHADKRPSEIAIIDDRGQYTWQELAAMSAGLGMYLKIQTRQPNVGVLLPSGLGFVVSFYGTLLAGKSVVPINFLLSEREIGHVIRDSGITTVLTAPPLAERLKNTPLKIIDLTQLPHPPAGLIPSTLPTPSPDDTAVLMYTSGTAGVPKGVMLSYGNLQSDADACIAAANLQQRHHFLGIVPLFHSFGMTATMIAPIQLGALMVYQARFSPAAAVAALRQHQVSLLFAVPSMFAAMANVKNATADDFASIYAMISGGEPLPPRLRAIYQEIFNKPLYEGYGLTETSPVIALNTPQFHRAGSVGKPLPTVTVRIVDDNGQPLPAGQEGEIWLQGPMIMKGYYKLPDLTADAITPEGFFKTGDVGKLDEDGYLFITGRKKEMIIVAGEKVIPREVEDALMNHPAVAEAAAVGKSDQSRGEVVVAFVTLREGHSATTEELRNLCRERGLPAWKCPREVFIVPELPRSPTGKVLKRVLAEQLAKSTSTAPREPNDQ